MHRCVCHREKDAAEIVLQANHQARRTQEPQYGGHDEKVGRGGDPQESCQWDVTEKQTEETKIGEIKG